MGLFRKPVARVVMTEREKVASAASFLARHAAKSRAQAERRVILDRCVELRRGPVAPITPREINIAVVRARRIADHG